MKENMHEELVDGKEIKRLRMEKKWSQQELGRRVQLSQSAISNIEKETCLQTRRGYALAKELGVSTDRIYNKDNGNLSTIKNGKDYLSRFRMLKTLFPDYIDIFQNVVNFE